MNGSLIAIMLGRLEMNVDECITAYRKLIGDVFREKKHRFSLSRKGDIAAKFSSKQLETAMNEVVTKDDGTSPSDLFNDTKPRSCRV